MQSHEYFLCSERIGFRWWAEDDFDLAKELWGDREVTKLFSKEPLSEMQIRERLKTEIERAKTFGMQYWPMFELASNIHIGCAGLRPFRDKQDIFELGFHLRPAHWGKGYATEASKAILDYGINHLGASAIYAGHHPDNSASRNVLLKLGFEETGIDYYEPTGLHHPSYMFYKK